MVDVLESHDKEGSSVGIEIEKAKENFVMKFKECHEKSNHANIKTLKSNFMAEMEGKIKYGK